MPLLLLHDSSHYSRIFSSLKCLKCLIFDSLWFSGRGRTERSCWFCLSSPNVESHLVLSIGESYYCALAKGPLVPNHVLLVPVQHCPNTLTMPLDTETELEKYKSALNIYFKNQAKAVVFFELIFPQSPHANLQVRRIFFFYELLIPFFSFLATGLSNHLLHNIGIFYLVYNDV